MNLTNLWNKEPVAIVNAVRLMALAAMSFGLKLTTAELVASMAALESVLTLFTRAQVTSADGLANMKPKDLAVAQNTSEPVADIVQKLP